LYKEQAVKPLSTLQYLHLSLLAKPACNRKLLQLVKKEQCQSFLEIGLGDGTRCKNMLRIANKFSDRPIRYTGVDLFDARPAGEPLKLIDMHKTLKAFDAKTQLVPGAAGHAIQRIANSHLRTDLIVISGETDLKEIESVISFFPRMLHANSCVLIQPSSDKPFRVLNRLDIERWTTKVAGSDHSQTSKANEAA
jgi:uncharacterized protein YbaR (Trm112 family)